MKRVQKASLEIVAKMHTQFRRLKTNFWALDLGVKIFSFLNVFFNDVTIFKCLIGTYSEHYKYHSSVKFQEV
jgi:hypothetical protein